jgi:hypothetical protein
MLLLESENSLKNKASEKNFNFFQNFAPEFPEKYVKSWINECKIKLLETRKPQATTIQTTRRASNPKILSS